MSTAVSNIGASQGRNYHMLIDDPLVGSSRSTGVLNPANEELVTTTAVARKR